MSNYRYRSEEEIEAGEKDDGTAHEPERPKRRGGPSGPSGRHLLSEVKLRGEEDEIERWTLAAARSGCDRNSFLRTAANQLADAILGE